MRFAVMIAGLFDGNWEINDVFKGARPKSETPLSKIVHVCNPLGVHNKNQPTQGSSPVQERPPYVDNHLGDHGHTRDR